VLGLRRRGVLLEAGIAVPAGGVELGLRRKTKGVLLRNRKMDPVALQCAGASVLRPNVALFSAFDHDHIFNELPLLGRELIGLIKAQ
jgi:hypothetical protein